jgi:hypothetical protein
MARSRVVVVINHAGISSMNYPGGHVYQFTRRMGRNTSHLGRVFAPKRRGELAAGVDEPNMRSFATGVEAFIWSTARHTMWVHEGTRTPITRPNGGIMPIHNASRTAVIAFRSAVRGQRANPFLARALRDAFRIEMARR